MGWLGTFLDRLRRTDAGAHAEGNAGGRSPYREAAGRPASGGLLTLDRLPRFAGWETVAILDEVGDLYVRYQVRSPDPQAPEHALACFAVDPRADEGWFAIAFDEARVLMRLAHPNLGRVIGMEGEGEIWWQLSERPRGVTLAALLSRVRYGAPPPGPSVVAAAFADFAEGLHAAHLQRDDDDRPLGIFYPELGPSALLLSLEGRGLVVDWGLSRLERTHVNPGAGPDGTSGGGHLDLRLSHRLRTIAPELTRGHAADGRADVFALGVMLHETWTGVSPFVADDDLALLRRIREHEPPPLSELDPGCPPSISALAQRALAKDPAARCSAGELAAGLRAGLAELGGGEPAALIATYLRSLSNAPA